MKQMTVKDETCGEYDIDDFNVFFKTKIQNQWKVRFEFSRKKQFELLLNEDNEIVVYCKITMNKIIYFNEKYIIAIQGDNYDYQNGIFYPQSHFDNNVIDLYGYDDEIDEEDEIPFDEIIKNLLNGKDSLNDKLLDEYNPIFQRVFGKWVAQEDLAELKDLIEIEIDMPSSNINDYTYSSEELNVKNVDYQTFTKLKNAFMKENYPNYRDRDYNGFVLKPLITAKQPFDNQYFSQNKMALG